MGFVVSMSVFVFFFFNDTATTEIYTLSLHDALPIYTPFLTHKVQMTKLTYYSIIRLLRADCGEDDQ